MPTRGEQRFIKQLLQTPQWAVAENVASQLREKFIHESSLKETEWETLQEAILKEGKVRGVTLFIQKLYRISLEPEANVKARTGDTTE